MRRELWMCALGLAVIAAAAGDADQTGRPPGKPLGVLVDIGSHKLHLHCLGPAGARPVVILP